LPQSRGYIIIPCGMNILAIHHEDKCRGSINIAMPAGAPPAA